MRDEGRRSAVQVINVSQEDFILGRGEFIGEIEQVTVADNEGTAWRPSEGEVVDEEEAVVLPGSPVEEPDIPKNRNAEHIQVKIYNLPAELDFDQRMAAKKFIHDRAGLFSKSDYIGRTNLDQHVIDTGMHRSFKQPLRRHPLAHLEIIDEHVSEMLQNDVIESAASLWA